MYEKENVKEVGKCYIIDTIRKGFSLVSCWRKRKFSISESLINYIMLISVNLNIRSIINDNHTSFNNLNIFLVLKFPVLKGRNIYLTIS